MGARSRAIVEQDFSWPVLADRTIALYRELVGKTTSGVVLRNP
jgi:glycosyltransferase involved in cell wall biosynthesis